MNKKKENYIQDVLLRAAEETSEPFEADPNEWADDPMYDDVGYKGKVGGRIVFDRDGNEYYVLAVPAESVRVGINISAMQDAVTDARRRAE